jgi:hypothetical protein
VSGEPFGRPRDPVGPILVASVTAVAALGLAIESVHAFSHAPVVEALVQLFSLSYEQNVPTWLATCLLFSSGIALARVAATASQRRAPMSRRWWALSIIFLYLSLDELAELHENLNGLAGGVVYFDWILPAAGVVLLLVALYLPFLRHLPGPTRRRFVLAAALYVGGALFMELPLGWWAAHAGEDTFGYALIDWVEETLELAGASVFLVAVRAHAARGGDR